VTRAGTRLLAFAGWWVAVTLLVAWATGALAPLGIAGLPEPGPVTRIGLPVVQALRDMAALLTVGLLVVAATCLAPEPGSSERSVTGVRRRAVQLAQGLAAAWLSGNLVLIGLVYSDASGSRLDAPGFWEQAAFFATSYELGQYLLWGAVLAAAVAATCALASSVAFLGVAALLSLAGLWPMALTGHAAGTLQHIDAVNLQMFHLVGIGVWAGGLLALVLLRPYLGTGAGAPIRHFSTLATWGLLLVTVSGVLGAALRLPSPGAIVSTYGALLGLKLAAVVVLAGLGHRQRHRLASEADLGGRTRFWRVLALEAAILVGAAGTGVALTRTAPPAPSGSPRPLTAAEAMLGSSLPPPLDAGAWWSGWSIDSLFLPFGLAAAVWYVLAVRRLATRGVRWPWWRTALWLTGCVLFLWATNGPPGTYGRVLFSMHMIQHMTIATAVPVFLVLGAPVTLALRTLRRRDDGSRGLREWLLQTVHSLPAQLLGHPIVASALFVVSMVAFYYSSLFELSLETHTGHVLMTLHFLLSGYLFAECLVGIDPGLRRPTYPIRTLLVMVTFGFHALFSVSLMASTRVLAEEWYAALGRTWGDSLADDQYLGASLGWLLGEYPLAVIAVALLVSWVSADRRERRRFDRSEAREGDRQLHAYNAYLAGLSARTDTMQPSQSTAVLGTAEEADRS